MKTLYEVKCYFREYNASKRHFNFFIFCEEKDIPEALIQGYKKDWYHRNQINFNLAETSCNYRLESIERVYNFIDY